MRLHDSERNHYQKKKKILLEKQKKKRKIESCKAKKDQYADRAQCPLSAMPYDAEVS